MSDEKTPDLREALAAMTEPPAEVLGVRVITSLDDPRLAPPSESDEAHAPTDPAPAAEAHADAVQASAESAEDEWKSAKDDAMPAVLGDAEDTHLPSDEGAQETEEAAVEEPLPPPPPAPPAPLPSHRIDYVPSDLDLEALPARVLAAMERLVDEERPNLELRRFDELRIEHEDVQALLDLGIKLVLMPHLPLPADILLADLHAHEHADPHEAVLLKVPEDSHPELLERVAAENANRELVAASNREQSRIAAENAAREEAKRVEEAAKKKN